MKISKKQKKINESINPEDRYKFEDALGLVKKHTSKKFDESVDVSVILGIAILSLTSVFLLLK